jgi:hypothetical protein
MKDAAGDGGSSDKNGGRKAESPELYFVTRRDAKLLFRLLGGLWVSSLYGVYF